MKKFKDIRTDLIESKKMKISNIPVEIKKVGKNFRVIIDGDKLDDYPSEEEAVKMAKEFVKQYKD